HGWYFKTDGGFRRSDDFTRSRVSGVEYRPDLVATEVISPPLDRVRIAYGSVRFDKDFANADRLAVEIGSSNSSGPTFTTGAGRYQLTRANSPWGRINFSVPGWNALAYYTGRKGNNEVSLSSGGRLFINDYNAGTELQWNGSFHHNGGRAVAGGSYGRQQ